MKIGVMASSLSLTRRRTAHCSYCCCVVRSMSTTAPAMMSRTAVTSQRSRRNSPGALQGAAGSITQRSQPKITEQRPGLLSSGGGSTTRRGEEGTRLVGGWRGGKREGLFPSASYSSASPDDCFRAVNSAPQRPSWWWGRSRAPLEVDTQAGEGSAAPLHPLHKPEKFSWIALFGGSRPPKSSEELAEEEAASRHRLSVWRRSSGSSSKPGTASPQDQGSFTSRSTARFLQAAKTLHGRKKGQSSAFNALLSDEQKLAIVNREIESRWWARWWYSPFRNVTDHRLKMIKRFLHFCLLLCSVTSFCVCVYVYRDEMRIISSLTPQDRSDYIYLASNMRYSDLWNMGMEVLNKEDPLEALSPAARYHLVLEEARRLGWTTTDWALAVREKHPHSALEEGDYIHVMFWMMMYVGSYAVGGGVLFSTRTLGDPASATVAEQRAAIASPPSIIGPSPSPLSKMNITS